MKLKYIDRNSMMNKMFYFILSFARLKTDNFLCSKALA